MRLPALDHGQRGAARLFVRAVAALSKRDAPDVIRTLCYRPGFFGGTYSEVLHRAMRGPSDWSVGERELFAAYTSRLNQCPF